MLVTWLLLILLLSLEVVSEQEGHMMDITLAMEEIPLIDVMINGLKKELRISKNWREEKTLIQSQILKASPSKSSVES
jgi:hypothetical protein